MGILGGIFSGKNKDTIVEGAVGLVKNIRTMIDEAQLTHEEAVKYNAKIADASAEFVKATLQENTVRSTTRRSIAVEFMRFFYILTIGVIVLWKFDPLWGEFVRKLIVDFQFGWAFVAIVVFFFGAHTLRTAVGKTKK